MAGRIRPSDEVVQANIKKWGIPQPDKEYTVLIHCTTYNHGKYIKDALEGFVMQKCSYSFCAIIIDDCSTDNNAEIIREYAEKYPDIIKPLLLGENHMQRGILRDPYFEKWHQSAKYIAQCEGDDFWTDPLKLQKECDYLDSHPEKSLVYTDCNVYFHDQGRLIKDAFKSGYFKKTTNYKDFFLEGKYLTPCSWVYKLKDYNAIKTPDFTTDGSLCKAFGLLLNDKVGYIDDTTCTYRVVHSGASHNSDLKVRYKYLRGVFETERYFLKEYSDYFTEEEVHYLYNKRYRGYIPIAVALNDKPFIKEIKDFKVEDIGWRYKLMLLFSWLPIARKYIYRRLSLSAPKGL